jgi:hypothetical protein
MGELLVTVGVAGIGLTVTDAVAGALVQPLTVRVTENVPFANGFAVKRIFCWVELKFPGPLQLKAPVPLALRLNSAPSQTVVVPVITGAVGMGITVTLTVPGLLSQPLTVWVTEYMPVASVLADVMVAFCDDALKALGPVQL